ncbi:MAG: hypothetical protein JWL83_4074 [Actinomycetia bacterium]|nr:hypothetical protein [Actinomycetes bacterium]
MSGNESAGDPIERALEVFVYAPLGLGLWLRDLAPSLIDTVVARGRAEVDRRHEQAQQHITTARSMGQVALAFGVPELRKRAEQQLGQVREHADRLIENVAPRGNGTSTTPSSPPPAPAREKAPAAAPARSSPTRAAAEPSPPSATAAAEPARSASSAHLPIPGYDALSASQVVERLAGLGGEELASVREYETAHRKRRTILGKIDQLTG